MLLWWTFGSQREARHSEHSQRKKAKDKSKNALLFARLHFFLLPCLTAPVGRPVRPVGRD